MLEKKVEGIDISDLFDGDRDTDLIEVNFHSILQDNFNDKVNKILGT